MEFKRLNSKLHLESGYLLGLRFENVEGVEYDLSTDAVEHPAWDNALNNLNVPSKLLIAGHNKFATPEEFQTAKYVESLYSDSADGRRAVKFVMENYASDEDYFNYYGKHRKKVITDSRNVVPVVRTNGSLGFISKPNKGDKQFRVSAVLSSNNNTERYFKGHVPAQNETNAESVALAYMIEEYGHAPETIINEITDSKYKGEPASIKEYAGKVYLFKALVNSNKGRFAFKGHMTVIDKEMAHDYFTAYLKMHLTDYKADIQILDYKGESYPNSDKPTNIEYKEIN